MRWFCRHRWTIIGPVGIGRRFSVAWCRCLKCDVRRERHLDGTEENEYIAALMTHDYPEPSRPS